MADAFYGGSSSNIDSLDLRYAKISTTDALTTSVGTNSSNISGNDSDIATLQSDVSALQTNVGTNDTDISNLQSSVSTLQTNVSSNDTDISNLQSSVSTLQTNVGTNDTDISNLQSDVSTLQSTSSLPLSGGTMTGAINVGGFGLTNVDTVTNPSGNNLDVSIHTGVLSLTSENPMLFRKVLNPLGTPAYFNMMSVGYAGGSGDAVTFHGNVVSESTIELDVDPTLGNHATHKSYVDTAVSATVDIPYLSLKKSSAQSITTGTTTKVTWDATKVLERGSWTITSNTDIAAPVDGLYLVNANITYDFAATGLLYLFGGTSNSTDYSIIQDFGTSTMTAVAGLSIMNTSFTVNLSALDTVSIYVNHSTGSSVNIGGSGAFEINQFTMSKIGSKI